jgi:hypothetical protein
MQISAYTFPIKVHQGVSKYYCQQEYILVAMHATNRRSDESRMTASALRLSCYIVTRPNMAYTEHSLIILSHIVLAKFARTSREIF